MTTIAPELREFEYVRPWLYPKQEEAFFNPARYSLVEASTKSGKTVGCIAWLFERAALDGRAGRNYWWVAPTLPVAKIAFRRMKRAIPRHLFTSNDTDSTITLVNGAVIWFKGADRPDTLYGEDVHGCVIDEASRCKEDAWIAVRTTLTATKGQVRIIGNVKGKQNWAYRLARKAEAESLRGAVYFRLTADDAITAGIFDSREVEDARSQMPEAAWRELYYAEAADDGSNPFGLEAIEACTMPADEWISGAPEREPICFGWDFARAQDWTVGIGLTRMYEVARFHRWQHVPWGETKQQVKQHTTIFPAWGDSTGVGDSVVEDLQRNGVPMIAVPFSAPMKQKLMERLAGALQQRRLRFPDGPIKAELEAFQYEYTPSGVRYSAPAGMHDDCVMALALAVFGRDQFGELEGPEKSGPVDTKDRHPGLDPATHRRKPWEEAHQPVAPDRRWTPGERTEPLDW